MDQPLLFLLKLAWECRYRLPLLITIGFMVLDIRMQLEINIHSRRVHRGMVPRQNNDQGQNGNANGQVNDNASESSGDSWFTLDEEDVSTASDAETPEENQNRENENSVQRHLIVLPASAATAELNNVNVEN